MKTHLIFVIAVFLLPFSAAAQQFSGYWTGKLTIPGSRVTISFHITDESGQYHATMDIPEQGAKAIKASSVSIDKKHIIISMDDIKVVYAGDFSSDTAITGEWQQSGIKLPLNLVKEDKAPQVFNRPQAVTAPFPYESNEVFFENKRAAIKLAGTLTMPKGKGNFTAVILVSGSGPQNRDSELYGHKSFEVLADYLTRNGIAVLRYDDRGVGRSGGSFSSATTFDFADDARAALEFLREQPKINHKKTGLIGHSEGGLVSQIVASGNMRPDFLVFLAAPAMDIDKLMLEQARLISGASGAPAERIRLQTETNSKAFALLKSGKVTDSTFKKIEDIYAQQVRTLAQGTLNETVIRDQAAQITKSFTPWFICFINLKPSEYLSKISGPVLALNGSKDLQVPAEQNLDIIKHILGSNKKVALTALELPGLNHLFQTAETGNPSEYGQIQETFSPDALKIISDWILLM